MPESDVGKDGRVRNTISVTLHKKKKRKEKVRKLLKLAFGEFRKLTQILHEPGKPWIRAQQKSTVPRKWGRPCTDLGLAGLCRAWPPGRSAPRGAVTSSCSAVPGHHPGEVCWKPINSYFSQWVAHCCLDPDVTVRENHFTKELGRWGWSMGFSRDWEPRRCPWPSPVPSAQACVWGSRGGGVRGMWSSPTRALQDLQARVKGPTRIDCNTVDKGIWLFLRPLF